MRRQNCIEVVRPFVNELGRSRQIGSCFHQMPVDIQIIGGVNTEALRHEKTVIDVNNKVVVASDNLYLPNIRKDGTLRDLDVLAQSCHPWIIDQVKRMVNETAGDALDESVFGFKHGSLLDRQTRHPFGAMALKTFLSDRYEVGRHNDRHLVKALFPFSVDIDKSSLETWTLIVGELQLPIPNPAMSVINYTNRSIAGIRPKDRQKIDVLADRIFSKAPELKDWAVDGPGASQVALGGLIRFLTPYNNHPNYFGISEKRMTVDQLSSSDNELLMKEVRSRSDAQRRAIVATAALKANILSIGESNPAIVTFWQRFIERNPVTDAIIRNK